MKLLVAYASTQGHTRAVAHHVMEKLYAQGHSVALMPVSEAGMLNLRDFDGAVLAASVHTGHYQKELGQFVLAQQDTLSTCPSLFLSVSLAAAGHDDEEWKSLKRIAEDMSAATGWTPGALVHVAGAYKPKEYDVVTRFIMRRIVASKQPDADLDAEIIYTDWTALDRSVSQWLEALSA